MRIALAGTGRLAAGLFKALLESEHAVVALVQNGRNTKRPWRTLLPLLGRLSRHPQSVTGIARRNKIPILWIDAMTPEELAPLAALEPDLLLVGGFAIILKEHLLRLPKIGCVNTHASLLPRHRGPNPFTGVLLSDDAETGVTFHRMDAGIDTGDILLQRAMPITPQDNAGSLYTRSSTLAAEMLPELLSRVEARGLQGAPQDAVAATYDRKLKTPDTYIDWAQPAQKIDRFVRACFPFSATRFRYRGKTICLSKALYDATPVDATPGTILTAKPPVKVATGQGTLTLAIAYTTKPLPFFWPRPWAPPTKGEVLE